MWIRNEDLLINLNKIEFITLNYDEKITANFFPDENTEPHIISFKKEEEEKARGLLIDIEHALLENEKFLLID